MSDPLLTAERDGLASMLLDVQKECISLRAALKASEAREAELRAALLKIIAADTHLVWTGGSSPEPSHEESGLCAEIARAGLSKDRQNG